jgi:Tfp pilus assembly protein PilO
MKLRINPSIAVVAVFATVFTGGFFLLLAPQLEPIGHNLARLNYYGTQKINLTNKDAKDTQDAFSKESDLVNSLLPAENQLYDLSVQIEALAKSKPVTLTGLNLNPAQSDIPQTSSTDAKQQSIPLPANLLKATVTVTATGSYAALQDFIVGLTRLKRYLQIQDLTLNTGGSDQVSVQITAVTFYLPNASN